MCSLVSTGPLSWLLLVVVMLMLMLMLLLNAVGSNNSIYFQKLISFSFETLLIHLLLSAHHCVVLSWHSFLSLFRSREILSLAFRIVFALNKKVLFCKFIKHFASPLWMHIKGDAGFAVHIYNIWDGTQLKMEKNKHDILSCQRTCCFSLAHKHKENNTKNHYLPRWDSTFSLLQLLSYKRYYNRLKASTFVVYCIVDYTLH